MKQTEPPGRTIEDYLRLAHVRIIASIDLANSTSFKTAKPHEWLRTYVEFYEQFPKALSIAYPTSTRDDAEQLTVFKYLGDEIIMTAPVERVGDLVPHVQAMRSAILNYNETLKGVHPPALMCKGTLWLAGFPSANQIVRLINGHKEVVTDFIGPSIDAGFRLAKLASPRRMFISLELLHYLAQAMKMAPVAQSTSDLRIYYEGAEHLHGILSGVMYPKFWVDVLNEIPTEQKLHGVERKPAELDHIISYTEAFYKKHRITSLFFGGESRRPFAPRTPKGNPTQLVQRYHKEWLRQTSGSSGIR